MIWFGMVVIVDALMASTIIAQVVTLVPNATETLDCVALTTSCSVAIDKPEALRASISVKPVPAVSVVAPASAMPAIIMSLALDVETPVTVGTLLEPVLVAGREALLSVMVLVSAPDTPKTDALACAEGVPLRLMVVVTDDKVPIAVPYHSSKSSVLDQVSFFLAAPFHTTPGVDKDETVTSDELFVAIRATITSPALAVVKPVTVNDEPDTQLPVT